MTDNEQKLVDSIEAVMKRNAIQCTANGYREAFHAVIKMFNAGKTKKEILEHAKWVTENYETALKYSIDNVDNV